MKECLQAHELITSIMDSEVKTKLTNFDLKTTVLRYVALDSKGKQELIRRLALQEEKRNEILLHTLAEQWFEHKSYEGMTDKHKLRICYQKDIILKFFNDKNIETTSNLNNDTAYEFIKWRNANNQKNKTLSASVLKHELQILKQIAKLAARNGYIQNGNLWDDVKIKSIAGINKKVVEPLTIEMQMDLLKKLRNTPHHDVALFLLIAGIRIGELETLNQNSIKNGALVLHGESIGNDKPIGGKTASASRTLPICPTMAKLFERGNIFNVSQNAFTIILNRNYKGIHAHRLRHTFAVNKLLAQVPLQMVSYQLGHSEIGITANLYGKFVPEHFKVGFEETIRIRKDFVKWLEQDYFKLS